MAEKVGERPNKVDDLREILDPGGYQQAAEQGIATLKVQLASLFVDLDMARETPEMTEKQRETACENLESLIRDVAWRINRAKQIVADSKKPPAGDPADNGA